MERYCPVCRSRLKRIDFCGMCGVKLDIKVMLTPGTLPEFKEKVLAK